MSLLVGQSLSKSFGAHDVFSDVSCRVEHGDRIGLVGPNGEGKTTLLRLLAGMEAPSAGQVVLKRGVRAGYLPQDPPPPGEQTLWDDVISAFDALRAQQAQLSQLEHSIAEANTDAKRAQLLTTYGEIQHAFEAAGGYTFELRAQQVLAGLGFLPDDYHKPLVFLSGGQRTRGLLAKLILQQPDLLFLDEPTNHLDLNAVEWLEQTLLEWPGALVVVAHDRYFLDKVVTRIWDMTRGRLEHYRGNYSHYAQQRADRLVAQQVQWQAQQEFIAETEAFVRRYKAGQRSKQARGRQTRLERFKRDELIERPQETRTIQLGLTTEVRSGDVVLRTKNLAIGYEQMLFAVPDLEVWRGQCIALIGPNGAGKTTFLKTLLEQVPPLRGSMRLGASVIVGYLAQANAGLDPEQTVLDAILAIENLPVAQARNFLGRFLFSGDDVFKKIGVLSGGQRSRVALARLTLQGANFLLLDEPTNHLDLASQEILQDVLDRFPGTILLVSHDRYLVDAIADAVWVLREEQLFPYEGNYQAYMRQLADEQAAVARPVAATPVAAQDARDRTREERRLRKAEELRLAQASELEAKIHAQEARLAQLERELAEAGDAREVERIARLGQQHAVLQEEINQLVDAWAALA